MKQFKSIQLQLDHIDRDYDINVSQTEGYDTYDTCEQCIKISTKEYTVVLANDDAKDLALAILELTE